MANKNPSRGRLTEIVASRRSQGSSVTGALAGGIKERLKEKFDPRQLINQKGLLAALFPGLKTYQAKTAATEISKTSLQSGSLNEIKPILEIISFNTKLTAKNTMVLPALHRDVNVIRQNMVKLVKMKGGDARTKADMFFTKAKEREDKYERELKKERSRRGGLSKLEDEKKENEGFFKKILSAITGGLGTIVKGIVGLGKVIIGTFKLLGELIFSLISTISNFIFNSLLSLAGLLKDGLDDVLGLAIKKAIKNFFTAGSFLSRILIGLGTSILGWLFSKSGIKALLMRLGPWIAAIAIAGNAEEIMELGKDIFSQSDPLEDYSFSKRMQDESKNVFPTTGIRTSTTEPIGKISKSKTGETYIVGNKNESARVSRPMSMLNLTPAELFQFNEKTLKESRQSSVEGKRYPFELAIPGMAQNKAFLLTGDEAREWGDMRKSYLGILEKYLSLSKGQTSYGGPGAEERKQKDLESWNESLSEIQSSMINWIGKIGKETLKPKDFESFNRRLDNIKARHYNPMENIKGKFTSFIKDQGFYKDMEREINEAEEKVIGLKNKAFNFIGEGTESAKNAVRESGSQMQERFTNMLNQFTQDNKQILQQTTSQPVIIQNNSVDKKQSTVTDRKPASAYDQNFLNWMQNFQYDGIIPNNP
jgi:hypothetical protein